MFGRTKGTNAVAYDQELFVIFDSKAQTYGRPVFVKNKEVLLRDILQLMRDPNERNKNQLCTNAEDFAVYRIGGFTHHDGKIEWHPPEHVCNLHELRALSAPEPAGPRTVQETGALSLT